MCGTNDGFWRVCEALQGEAPCQGPHREPAAACVATGPDSALAAAADRVHRVSHCTGPYRGLTAACEPMDPAATAQDSGEREGVGPTSTGATALL